MSVSVAELFDELVSAIPRGAVTAAVLVSDPVALAAIGTLTEYVADAPTGKLTLSLIDPLPDDAHVPPPAPAQVQFIDVAPVGSKSVTLADVTVDGPTFVTTTV